MRSVVRQSREWAAKKRSAPPLANSNSPYRRSARQSSACTTSLVHLLPARQMGRRRAAIVRLDRAPSPDAVSFPSAPLPKSSSCSSGASGVCSHSTHHVPFPTLSLHSSFAPHKDVPHLRHTAPLRDRRHSSLPSSATSPRPLVPFPSSDETASTLPTRDSGYASTFGTLESAMKKREVGIPEARLLSGPQRVVGVDGALVRRRKHKLAMQFAKLERIGIPACSGQKGEPSTSTHCPDI